MLSTTEIIKEIEEFCCDYSAKNTHSHDSIQTDLTNFLQKFGCQVIGEYELIFVLTIVIFWMKKIHEK